MTTIAVDYDGTITWYPEFFAWLTWQFAQSGHEVIVLTGQPEVCEPYIRRDLAYFGITYHRLACFPGCACDWSEDRDKQWKYQTAVKLGVKLWFDDDPKLPVPPDCVRIVVKEVPKCH